MAFAGSKVSPALRARGLSAWIVVLFPLASVAACVNGTTPDCTGDAASSCLNGPEGGINLDASADASAVDGGDAGDAGDATATTDGSATGDAGSDAAAPSDATDGGGDGAAADALADAPPSDAPPSDAPVDSATQG
jgi:hypothetical protein